VRSSQDEMEGVWEQEMDSDRETKHFVYPVEGRKRGNAETVQKRANDKIYPELLPAGMAKGKERMAQPPRMKETNVPRFHGTRSRMQEQGLVDTDNPDKVQVPTAVPVRGQALG